MINSETVRLLDLRKLQHLCSTFDVPPCRCYIFKVSVFQTDRRSSVWVSRRGLAIDHKLTPMQ